MMQSRTKQLKKNVYLSFLLKALGVGISFLQLPLTISYLTEVEYGIWVTVFSTMNWINVLDMGIGLGVRNKLAIAVSSNDIAGARSYVSTGIFSMLCIAAVLFVILLGGINFVDMQTLFNTRDVSQADLYGIVLWMGIFVIAAFASSIVNQFYYAYQEAAKTGAMAVLGSIIMLCSVYWLTLQESHNLLYFVFAFGISSIISRAVYIALFFIRHPEVIFSISAISVKKMYEVSGLGIKFFIIQICTIFCFSISNMLITQLLGPESVRTYDIVFKIMNFIVMIQSLFLTPLWSAYTDAYAKRDFIWIKKALVKTNVLLLFLLFLLLLVAYKIDFIIKIWLHIDFVCEHIFLMWMVLYNSIMLLAGNYCNLLNGIGKINVQLVAYIFVASMVIPLAYLIVVYFNLGLVGIVVSLTIPMAVLTILLMGHVYYIFFQWGKFND